MRSYASSVALHPARLPHRCHLVGEHAPPRMEHSLGANSPRALAMVVIDATQLVVALCLKLSLASIQHRLQFAVTDFTHVVEGYVLAFGGTVVFDAILSFPSPIAIGRIMGGGQMTRRL